MEQIKRCDVAPSLAAPGVAIVLGVPAQWFFGVLAEVMHLLAGRQVHPGVLLQQFLKAGGAPFLGTKPEKVGQSQPLPGPSEFFGGMESHRAVRVSVTPSCSACCVQASSAFGGGHASQWHLFVRGSPAALGG